MEKEEPKPDNFDNEAAKFFEQEDEKNVDALHEAFRIDRALKLCLKYIKEGLIREDMPLMEALEKLEAKKFELIEIDPDDIEEEENEK